jgi:hypothetical protein
VTAGGAVTGGGGALRVRGGAGGGGADRETGGVGAAGADFETGGTAGAGGADLGTGGADGGSMFCCESVGVGIVAAIVGDTGGGGTEPLEGLITPISVGARRFFGGEGAAGIGRMAMGGISFGADTSVRSETIWSTEIGIALDSGSETSVCSETAGATGSGTGGRWAAINRRWRAWVASSISSRTTRNMVRRTAAVLTPGAGLESVTRQRPRIATERSRSRIANRPSVPTASSLVAGRISEPSEAKAANFSTNSSTDVQRVATWIRGPRAWAASARGSSCAGSEEGCGSGRATVRLSTILALC